MSKKEKIVYTILGIFLALLVIFNTLWVWLMITIIPMHFHDPYMDYPALATQRGTEYILMGDAAYIRTDRVYLDPKKVESGEIEIYNGVDLRKMIMEERERILAENESNPEPAEE